jgi:hypothetical protein
MFEELALDEIESKVLVEARDIDMVKSGIWIRSIHASVVSHLKRTIINLKGAGLNIFTKYPRLKVKARDNVSSLQCFF